MAAAARAAAHQLGAPGVAPGLGAAGPVPVERAVFLPGAPAAPLAAALPRGASLAPPLGGHHAVLGL